MTSNEWNKAKFPQNYCDIFLFREKYFHPYQKNEFVEQVAKALQHDQSSYFNSQSIAAENIADDPINQNGKGESSPCLDDSSANYISMHDHRLCSSSTRHDQQHHFEIEFSELEHLTQDTIQRRTLASRSPAINQKRNRYHDIVPFDATRVRLNRPMALRNETVPSDYINASFITDYVPSFGEQSMRQATNSTMAATNVRRYSQQQSTVSTNKQMPNQSNESHPVLPRYIAAQGPGEETTPLFWEMVWQQNVRVIVMLTNLVEGAGFHPIKCSMYWPNAVGKTCRFNDLTVQLYDVQEAPDYTLRKLDVSKIARQGSGRGSDGSTVGNREVMHIQYTSWPDRSAPDDPGQLIQLINLTRVLSKQYSNTPCQGCQLSISSLKPAEKTLMSASTLNVADDNVENSTHGCGKGHPPAGPWLVHCSAGVGRTGSVLVWYNY